MQLRVLYLLREGTRTRATWTERSIASCVVLTLKLFKLVVLPTVPRICSGAALLSFFSQIYINLRFSKLSMLSNEHSASGFDLVQAYITLAKLFVLKKSWHPAADFAIASLAFAFHKQNLRCDSLKNDSFDNPEHPVHLDVMRFLSDHSCLVHILVLTDRTAEILPYLPKLERVVKLNMLQMHHADSVPPIVVFYVACSEVYRAANMPSRSAASMKHALDLLQVDPGIQRRLAHAPTSHTGNLSFDPRVMARVMQSQSVLAARMKQRDEKEGRLPDVSLYRPPRVPLPVAEFELPSYIPGLALVFA